jgi:hypothetical protein
MNKRILSIIALSLVVFAACNRKLDPGASSVAIGSDYKTSAVLDSAIYATDSFVNFQFKKITLNLDTISKTIYASSSTPTEATISSVTMDFGSEFVTDYFEHDAELYISATGVAPKLFGKVDVSDAEHYVTFKPGADINMMDYVGKGDLLFRTKMELIDATDITSPLSCALKASTLYKFPK